MSEAYPHLIFQNFDSKMGQRIKTILQENSTLETSFRSCFQSSPPHSSVFFQALFPVPSPTSTRSMSFINQHDSIHFRHHIFEKTEKDVKLAEVGPRFMMQLYRIELGPTSSPLVSSVFLHLLHSSGVCICIFSTRFECGF